MTIPWKPSSPVSNSVNHVLVGVHLRAIPAEYDTLSRPRCAGRPLETEAHDRAEIGLLSVFLPRLSADGAAVAHVMRRGLHD